MYLEKDEMKFAILYTLEKNVEPMSMSLLCEVLTWDKNVMGYFELAEMLAELIEDNYAERVNYRGEEAFRKGHQRVLFKAGSGQHKRQDKRRGLGDEVRDSDQPERRCVRDTPGGEREVYGVDADTGSRQSDNGAEARDRRQSGRGEDDSVDEEEGG